MRLRDLLVLSAGFTIVALAMTLPIWVHPGRVLPSDLVDTLLNAWIIGWDSDRFAHFLRGVWDSPIYYPYRNTLAFSENLLGLAVFVAPVYWVTGNAVLTYNVAFAFSFVVAGLGMYLLAHTLTGSRAAATVGAVFYAFCPFRLAQISHIQMVATGWIPVALYGLHQYFRTGGRIWLGIFAAGFCLQALSNSYVAYFMALPVAIVMADGVLRDRTRLALRARDLAVAGLLIGIVLGPVVYRYYRVRFDYGLVRNSIEISMGSADVRSYLVGKSTIGIWRWLPTAVPYDPEKELFPGVLSVALALIALWHAARRDRHGGRGDEMRHSVALYSLIAVVAVLFSLGPHVRVWGHLITDHGPYGWLLRFVPGMDGMRVPARFAIIVFVALSVLAACGARVALGWLPGRFRVGATAACALVLLSESWAVPLMVFAYPARGRPADRAVAEWLRHKASGAVLHLPMTTSNFQELNFQFATLIHHHPLVNGFSGYNTPVQALLRDSSGPMYDYPRFAATVRMLRSIGVLYVVVHRDDYTYGPQIAREYELMLDGLRGSAQVVQEQTLLDAHAFELEGWPDPAPAVPDIEVTPSEMTLSVAQNEDRAPFLVDRDPDTRWLGEQNGASWVATAFSREYDVTRVELQIAERSLVDYPRELRIDAMGGRGETRTLYQATPYPEFIAGFLRNPRYPAMVIRLPRNATTKLWIRASAEVPERWWSIHELRLWRRD